MFHALVQTVRHSLLGMEGDAGIIKPLIWDILGWIFVNTDHRKHKGNILLTGIL